MENHAEPRQNATQQQELFEFNLLQMLNYFFSYRLWIVIATGVSVLLTTFWVVFVRQPIYRATVNINIDITAEDRGVQAISGSQTFLQDQVIANKISIVEQYFDSQNFRTYLFRTIADGNVPPHLKEDLHIVWEDLLKNKTLKKSEVEGWFAGKVYVKGSVDKFRMDFVASAGQPALASAVANIGAYALVEYNRDMLLKRLRSLKTFLNGQVKATKSDLKTLENRLVSLQKSAKIFAPEDVKVKINSIQVDNEARLIEINRQFTSLNSLISETEADLTYFKNMMQDSQQGHSSSALYVDQIQKRLEVLRYQRQQQAKESGGDPKAYAEIDKSIQSIVGELSRQLQTIAPLTSTPWEYIKKIEAALFDLRQKRAQAKSEMEAQRAAVQAMEKEYVSLPENLKNLSEVKRSIDLANALHTTLMTRLQETQIKEASQPNDLVLVSSAEPPGVPSGLSRSKTVSISIIGGLVLSLIPLFLRFVLLPTIRNVKDLSHLGVPIIGELPWFQSNAFSLLRDRFVTRHPRLLKEAPSSSETNALRFLRFKVDQVLKLRERAPNEMGRILQISSINSAEGRTFVAANLADLYAASGVQTCLLDLDFTKQNLIHYFPSSVTEGSPLMRNFPRECNFVMKRVHPHLFIVRTTPTHADRSEALETTTFESALSALRMKFDVVIVDTPPITGHMEAVVAAQYADALLMVIDQRATLRNEVETKIRVLQESLKLPIIAVMNFAFDDIFRAGRRLSMPKWLKRRLGRGGGDPHEPRGGGGGGGTGGGGGGGGTGAPQEPKAPKFPKAPGTEIPYDMPLPPGVATGSAQIKVDINPAAIDDASVPLPPPIPGAEPPSRPKRDMFAQVEGRKPFAAIDENEEDFKLDPMNSLVEAPDPEDLKDQPQPPPTTKKKKDPKAG